MSGTGLWLRSFLLDLMLHMTKADHFIMQEQDIIQTCANRHGGHAALLLHVL